MKKTHRLVLLSTTLLGALALAAPALAGYTPRLSVFSTGQSPGSAGVKVKYSQASNDDAVQRLSVFVPKGYTLSVGGAVGTRIGSATLSVVAGDIHKAVKTTGPLVVASASDFQTEAQACTSGATHAAVWSVTVAVSGTAFRIPIYVDTSMTGIFVQLLYGSTPKALKAHGVLSTNRSGEFAAKGELKQGSRAQKMYFQVTTNEIEKDLGVAGCVATTPGVVPCIDATLPYN